jgi:hypothetical protein
VNRAAIDESKLNLLPVLLLLLLLEWRSLPEIFIIHGAAKLSIERLESLLLYTRDMTSAVSQRRRDIHYLLLLDEDAFDDLSLESIELFAGCCALVMKLLAPQYFVRHRNVLTGQGLCHLRGIQATELMTDKVLTFSTLYLSGLNLKNRYRVGGCRSRHRTDQIALEVVIEESHEARTLVWIETFYRFTQREVYDAIDLLEV